MLKNYKEILTVKDLCEILGIGKNTAYNLLKSGEIRSVKIGKIYKIPKDFLINYLKSSV